MSRKRPFGSLHPAFLPIHSRHPSEWVKNGEKRWGVNRGQIFTEVLLTSPSKPHTGHWHLRAASKTFPETSEAQSRASCGRDVPRHVTDCGTTQGQQQRLAPARNRHADHLIPNGPLICPNGVRPSEPAAGHVPARTQRMTDTPCLHCAASSSSLTWLRPHSCPPLFLRATGGPS